jgi:hypothetical protein
MRRNDTDGDLYDDTERLFRWTFNPLGGGNHTPRTPSLDDYDTMTAARLIQRRPMLERNGLPSRRLRRKP